MTDSTPSVLSDYAEAQATKPKLGSILWYSFHKDTIPYADLIARLDAHGLKAYASRRPTPISQFKRVAKANDRSIDLLDGNTAKIMVRKVGKGDDNLLRKVVVETIDVAGRRLSYSESHNLEFNRDTERLIATPLTFDTTAAPLVAAITADYADGIQRELLTEGAVRTAITNAIADNHGVCIRSNGGIYFMPLAYERHLDNIEAFAAGLEFVDLAVVPLPDDPKQTQIVANGVAENSLNQAAAFSVELAKMLQADADVSESSLANIVTGYKALRARLAEYEELLGQDLSTVGTRLDVLDRQVQAVALKMRVTGAAS